jgi:hypothetical protein
MNPKQGAHGSIYAHGPRKHDAHFENYQGVYQDNQLELQGYLHKHAPHLLLHTLSATLCHSLPRAPRSICTCMCMCVCVCVSLSLSVNSSHMVVAGVGAQSVPLVGALSLISLILKGTQLSLLLSLSLSLSQLLFGAGDTDALKVGRSIRVYLGRSIRDYQAPKHPPYTARASGSVTLSSRSLLTQAGAACVKRDQLQNGSRSRVCPCSPMRERERERESLRRSCMGSNGKCPTLQRSNWPLSPMMRVGRWWLVVGGWGQAPQQGVDIEPEHQIAQLKALLEETLLSLHQAHPRSMP